MACPPPAAATPGALQAAPPPPPPSPTMQLLAEAERRASQGVVGAAACWADAALLQTVHEVLLPPSSNLQLAQWSRQPELLQVGWEAERGVVEKYWASAVACACTASLTCRQQVTPAPARLSSLHFLQALQLVRQLLQHPPAEQPEAYASAARLTIQAAYAAVAVSDQAVCAALEALSFVQKQGEAAEGGEGFGQEGTVAVQAMLSGRPAVRVVLAMAACFPGGRPSSVSCLTLLLPWALLNDEPLAGLEQEAVVLYCELISHRGSWRINAAGCRALAESSAAAAGALLSGSGGAPGALQRWVPPGVASGCAWRPSVAGTLCDTTSLFWRPHLLNACLLGPLLGPACRSATAILQTVLDKKASGRLCRCIEDAHSGMAQGAPLAPPLMHHSLHCAAVAQPVCPACCPVLRCVPHCSPPTPTAAKGPPMYFPPAPAPTCRHPGCHPQRAVLPLVPGLLLPRAV